MITLIISIICFIALVALSFFIGVKNNKTFIMAGIVMLMLLVTIVDELILPKYPVNKVQGLESFQYKPLQNSLKLNISTQIYKNTPARTLLKQERTLLSYLLQKQTNKQNIVLHIKNIDNSRFRAIFRQFQHQTQVPAVHLDFHQHQYNYGDLENILAKGRRKDSDGIVYIIVGGLGQYQHFSILENLFLTYNVSYILQSIPINIFELSTLSKWTHEYQFQGNYISQVLENHPPRLVQICNKYRTIDYSFYILSQTQPLSQLCTKLPSNQVTECIRKKLTKVQDRVPFSKVRKCFTGNSMKSVDGVIYENGMVGVKKDYYYSGRVDKSVFLIDQTPNENL